ncbi:MAG: SDR family NAD(P)-dependent oxidoreductase [Burkholderiales bacterium]|nr:SDR family NAD(P)-dependent oxidoreductase [Burkholderiales bacterium]
MRVVIVTGVSRGLGPAIARVLLDRGLTVLGVGRSSAAGLEGDRYRFAPCDLADLAGIDAALAGAFGALALHSAHRQTHFSVISRSHVGVSDRGVVRLR